MKMYWDKCPGASGSVVSALLLTGSPAHGPSPPGSGTGHRRQVAGVHSRAWPPLKQIDGGPKKRESGHVCFFLFWNSATTGRILVKI